MARFFKQTRPVYQSSDDADIFRYDVIKNKEGDTPLTLRPQGMVGGTYTKEQYHYNNFDKGISPLRFPSQLFRYDPATVNISHAFFDPKVRSHAVPLMARIAADYPAAATIEASEDLSKHSSKLVNKAQEIGLPVTSHKNNPTSKETNDVTFHDIRSSVAGVKGRDSRTFEELPKEHIEESMKPVRAQIRAASIARKENKLSGTQFPQTQLPGMESF